MTQPTPYTSNDYIEQSLSVDAACSGNPGVMEYQVVATDTLKPIFQSPTYPVGTNNIGEFLAIVEALKYLKSINDTSTPVYSDSITALAWVRRGSANTKLPRNADTELLHTQMDRAEEFLEDNIIENPIIKWETKLWGESKADYGRK